MATIWVGVTETTVASTPLKLEALAPRPNSTCTGGPKPVPVMVTRVPPSLVPEAGLTEKTDGWTAAAAAQGVGEPAVERVAAAG